MMVIHGRAGEKSEYQKEFIKGVLTKNIRLKAFLEYWAPEDLEKLANAFTFVDLERGSHLFRIGILKTFLVLFDNRLF